MTNVVFCGGGVAISTLSPLANACSGAMSQTPDSKHETNPPRPRPLNNLLQGVACGRQGEENIGKSDGAADCHKIRTQ